MIYLLLTSLLTICQTGLSLSAAKSVSSALDSTLSLDPVLLTGVDTSGMGIHPLDVGVLSVDNMDIDLSTMESVPESPGNRVDTTDISVSGVDDVDTGARLSTTQPASGYPSNRTNVTNSSMNILNTSPRMMEPVHITSRAGNARIAPQIVTSIPALPNRPPHVNPTVAIAAALSPMAPSPPISAEPSVPVSASLLPFLLFVSHLERALERSPQKCGQDPRIQQGKCYKCPIQLSD